MSDPYYDEDVPIPCDPILEDCYDDEVFDEPVLPVKPTEPLKPSEIDDEVDYDDISRPINPEPNWRGPSPTPTEENEPPEEVSIMPFYTLMATSYGMVFASFYFYTEQVYKWTDGTNYSGMFYATQLAWVPVLITTTMQMFTSDSLAWEFVSAALWEAAAGATAYNWLGLVWA